MESCIIEGGRGAHGFLRPLLVVDEGDNRNGSEKGTAQGDFGRCGHCLRDRSKSSDARKRRDSAGGLAETGIKFYHLARQFFFDIHALVGRQPQIWYDLSV